MKKKKNLDIRTFINCQLSKTRQLIRLQVKTEKNIKINVGRDNRTNEVTTKAIGIPKHVIKMLQKKKQEDTK